MLPGGDLDTEGLDVDVQRVRYKDDGAVEVTRWINGVQRNFFRGTGEGIFARLDEETS